MNMRNCEHCGAPYIRTNREPVERWSRRRFCGLSCTASHRAQERREQVLTDTEWLLETEEPGRIATRLGYANPANLGRVLRRWGRADLARTFERAS